MNKKVIILFYFNYIRFNYKKLFCYSVNSIDKIPCADLRSGIDDFEEKPTQYFQEYVPPSAIPSALSHLENDDADPDKIDEDDIRVDEYCTDRPTATVLYLNEDTIG